MELWGKAKPQPQSRTNGLLAGDFMKYVNPKIYMVDRWIEEGEMWVEIHDGKEGLNRSIIIANAKTATAARRRAKRTLLGLVNKLEKYDDC